jgi:hypothetical protein
MLMTQRLLEYRSVLTAVHAVAVARRTPLVHLTRSRTTMACAARKNNTLAGTGTEK